LYISTQEAHEDAIKTPSGSNKESSFFFQAVGWSSSATTSSRAIIDFPYRELMDNA
jgi:hypothetical protein